ncbi:RteC domain-containing protein [Kaistella daneshvariae]|nr:RteC domain-containing protein [Kaistella daneshvariae]
MDSKELIGKTVTLWEHLQKKLLLLKREKPRQLEYAQYALMETDEAIRTLKPWVISHHFDSWESEVLFFKVWKPKFIAKFIYYSKVVHLLSWLPQSGNKFKKNVYSNELENLRLFAENTREFLSYYRRGATYLDHKYFLRFKYDLDVNLAVDLHSYDERFSTTHDHLVSQILAFEDYEVFLTELINQVKAPSAEVAPEASKLRWTASKVALTELLFALHHTHCFNGGNISLAETVKWFEDAWNIDLGNYHNTVAEIRNRKSHPMKFLKLLSDNLHTYLEDDDAAWPPPAK